MRAQESGIFIVSFRLQIGYSYHGGPIMKRVLALLLAMAMMLGTCLIMASCVATPEQETTDGSTTTTTETESKKNETTETDTDGKDTTDTEGKDTTETEGTDTTETEGTDTTETEAPLTTESEAPATTESEAPVTTESETPVTTESEAPVTTESEAPVTTESEAPVTTESEAPVTTESEDKGDETVETKPATPPVVDPDEIVYNDGAELDKAGIDWEEGFFANTKHKVDMSVAQEITAAELLEKMLNRTGDDALKDGEVWIVKDRITIDRADGNKYYGNGAVIIAEAGILVKNSVDVVIKNVIIKGEFTIKNSPQMIFYKVDIESAKTAINIDANSSDISFNNCRLYGNDYAVKSKSDGLTIYSSYIRALNGAQLEGNDIIVQNCKIFALYCGLSVKGSDAVIRENTVRAESSGTGISVEAGSVNALVALNDIAGIQNSIEINGALNTAVVLNRAIIINGKDNTNLYLVDNNVGGYLDVTNNNYLICEGNKYPVDGLSHKIVDLNNDNVNGNNITNVNARVEVGANEDLLPHTNKELFVGMPRKTTVADAALTTEKGFNSYLKEYATTGDIVIVPPGAYSVPATVYMDKPYSNTTIYAYGVYSEYSETNPEKYAGKYLYNLYQAENVNLYGVTIGVAIPSSGQVRVVEKYIELKNGERYSSEEEIPMRYANETRYYRMTIVTDAGFYDGFTKADETKPDSENPYHTFWPETFIYDEATGEYRMFPEENPDSFHDCVRNYDENRNYDGTMTYTIRNKNIVAANGSNLNYGSNKYTATGMLKASAGKPKDGADQYWYAEDIWNRITVNTVMTCRWGQGSYHIYACNSQNINVRDCVLYGYAGGMANVALSTDNITYERFHNTYHSASLIDQETYEKYLAIEQKYPGVDMEIATETVVNGRTGEEELRYRGAPSRTGTIDAFHITSTKTGYNVISSLLEGMVDDGSNQKANSSRLRNIRDNGDGTVTIEYADTMYSTKWGHLWQYGNEELGVIYCRTFSKGEIVYIYAPSGELLCETPALTNSVRMEDDTYSFTGGPKGYYTIAAKRYSVTVKADDVNWEALKVPSATDKTSTEYKLAKKAGEEGYEVGTKLYNHITVKPGEAYYDLSNWDTIQNGGYDASQRMTVDNLTWNACNYVMDNVVVNNGHSRGYLIKSTDVTIKHCTFRNVSYAGLLIKPEWGWAESSISRRILVDRCLFDNTGYMSNQLDYREFACITICSTSTIASERTLPIEDITITGCKFTNNKIETAIYINSAKNITIKNNVFDDVVVDPDYDKIDRTGKKIEINGCAVLLKTCMNIEISDNEYNYAHFNGDITNVVRGDNYANIFGSDVTGEDGEKLIPDNLK